MARRDDAPRDLLAEQGVLRPEHRPLLDALVEAHLKLHGGNPEKSLAAVGVGQSTRERLARIGNPDLDESLARVGPPQGNDGAPVRTLSLPAGSSTSAGRPFWPGIGPELRVPPRLLQKYALRTPSNRSLARRGRATGHSSALALTGPHARRLGLSVHQNPSDSVEPAAGEDQDGE